jgi:hypothetical protein
MVWREVLYGNTRYRSIGAIILKIVSAGEHAAVPIGQTLAPTPSFYFVENDRYGCSTSTSFKNKASHILQPIQYDSFMSGLDQD